MHITRTALDQAVEKGLIQAEQSAALWAYLQERDQQTPGFKPAHVLYYLGGMIAIGAMTLFMNLGWEQFGGGGLLLIALVYMAGALALTETLMRRAHLQVPAGITATLAVVMVPLATYGAQHLLGWWPDTAAGSSYHDYHTQISWRWLMMELATLAAAALALWRYKTPFLMMPVAVTLWYMSMDLVPYLLGGDSYSFFSHQGKLISTGFGLLMVAGALVVDVRSRHSKDFAFWLYLWGALTFWGGLSSMDSGSELGKLGYAGINLGLIALGAMLSRRVFAVLGGLGLAGYLGHLSYAVFKNSMLFPVALTAIGLGVIAAGVWWQRREAAIGARLRTVLPQALRELVESRQGQ